MAGFLELIDNTLGTNFNTPVYDPKVGRKKLVKAIDTAAKQHSDNVTRAPNRAWKTGGNNAISFTPKIDGKPVKIAGQTTNYVPAERFQDFLSGLKAAVEAGDLDKEIKAALDSDGTPKASAPRSAAAGAGSTREVGEQSKLNIGVAAKRRAANPPSFDDIRAYYIETGADSAKVDAAIAKRKAAEAAAK
ncbi:hypothetical protein [Sphingomonas hankookensis]|uniref:hypothetical protein n=1 Tax=Sphingomonas hankookensis TaxID=563996 RepID=UPI00234F7FFB|nr:hypothetical protein [Sphingomonas hankookensis]WCP72200.1 hypothetical protein PPZ50_01140 [Sphingomonas hankookensis]